MYSPICATFDETTKSAAGLHAISLTEFPQIEHKCEKNGEKLTYAPS
jgi:hypothetical protein